MHATSIFSDEILKQADELRVAEGRYEQQFDLWAQSVPPLSPEHFWKEIDILHSIWVEKGCDAEAGVEEYLRRAVCEGEERFAAAVHFAVSYRRYTEALRMKCEHITCGWQRGDDSFGDLMDALPMAGEQVYVRVKGGEFFTDDEDEGEGVDVEELEQSVIEARPESCKHIIVGENYFASTLERISCERMKFVLCTLRN
jgi:hypothetical protein